MRVEVRITHHHGTWNLWPVCHPGPHRPAAVIPGLKPGKVVPA